MCHRFESDYFQLGWEYSSDGRAIENFRFYYYRKNNAMAIVPSILDIVNYMFYYRQFH